MSALIISKELDSYYKRIILTGSTGFNRIEFYLSQFPEETEKTQSDFVGKTFHSVNQIFK